MRYPDITIPEAVAYVRKMEEAWGNASPMLATPVPHRDDGVALVRIVARNPNEPDANVYNVWDVWVDGSRGVYGEC